MTGPEDKDHQVIPFDQDRRRQVPGRRAVDHERVKILEEMFDAFQALEHPCENEGCGHVPCRWTRRIGKLLGRDVKTFGGA